MPISRKLRFEVFRRDNFTCQYCGRQTPAIILEVDHIFPKARGGHDDTQNLITSCFDCNRGKGPTLLGKIKKIKTRKELAVTFKSNDIVNLSYALAKLHVSRMTIYRWAKQGKILAVKFGKSTFIPKSEIERLNREIKMPRL